MDEILCDEADEEVDHTTYDDADDAQFDPAFISSYKSLQNN